MNSARKTWRSFVRRAPEARLTRRAAVATVGPGLRRDRNLPTGSLVLVLAPLMVPLLGCGPVEYINQVGNKAASAVSAAKLASAERYAPYEYTAAEEYLHKAREEAGHAEYQEAIEYGRKAVDLAYRSWALTCEHWEMERAAVPYVYKCMKA